MQIYDAGNWQWYGIIIPTEHNALAEPGIESNNTCIDAEIMKVQNINTFRCGSKSCYNEEWQIISIKEYYHTQKITQNIIRELNEYYNKYHPDRQSKG
jgi:hypothetical protein